MNTIKKFSPHEMDAETVMALATGRKALLNEVLETVNQNLEGEGIQHLVLSGPRGMGKSFFITWLKATLAYEKNQCIDFVLLPEEHPNINAPSELIEIIIQELKGQTEISQIGKWDDTDEWNEKIAELDQLVEEKRIKCKQYLLIISIENLDVLLKDVFDNKTKESKFRKWLDASEYVMILGARMKADMDKSYNKRLFKNIHALKLEPWGEDEYKSYFERRKAHWANSNKEAAEKIDFKRQEYKLRAISKFTGGSPRMAVVLTNLLLSEDALSAAETLDGIVENLVPYYQDLLGRTPKRSRILFDALIRNGEGLTQTQLADKVGAQQSNISNAFKWLVENDFIRGEKAKGERAARYFVTDRIFSLYFQKRYVLHGQKNAPIKVMADFLSTFYSLAELNSFSHLYLTDEFKKDSGEEFALLALKKMGIDIEALEKPKLTDYFSSLAKDDGDNNWEGDVEHLVDLVMKSELKIEGVKKDEFVAFLDLQDIDLIWSFLINFENGAKSILEQLSEKYEFKFSNNYVDKCWSIMNDILDFKEFEEKKFKDINHPLRSMKTLVGIILCFPEMNNGDLQKFLESSNWKTISYISIIISNAVRDLEKTFDYIESVLGSKNTESQFINAAFVTGSIAVKKENGLVKARRVNQRALDKLDDLGAAKSKIVTLVLQQYQIGEQILNHQNFDEFMKDRGYESFPDGTGALRVYSSFIENKNFISIPKDITITDHCSTLLDLFPAVYFQLGDSGTFKFLKLLMTEIMVQNGNEAHKNLTLLFGKLLKMENGKGQKAIYDFFEDAERDLPDNFKSTFQLFKSYNNYKGLNDEQKLDFVNCMTPDIRNSFKEVEKQLNSQRFWIGLMS